MTTTHLRAARRRALLWIAGVVSVTIPRLAAAEVDTATTASTLEATPAPETSPSDSVYADGRDRWTLLRPSTVNRNLNARDNAPGYDGRLLLNQGRFSGALDGIVGWQQPFDSGPQTRFHGYYVLDTYVGFEVIEQLELTVNLTIFNPSASDGYRASADILTGFTVHLHETFMIDGEPLRVDIVGFDLDVVTTGVGLFFEQLPVEGWLIGARYGGSEFRMTWGGRALFSDDNFLYAQATALDGRIGLTYTSWFGDLTASEIGDADQVVDSFHGVYIGAFTNLELGAGFRFGAEYGARLDTGEIRSAAMARLDFKTAGRIGVPVELHIGYQARMYLNQFGPRSIFVEPTQTPNTPRRENVYVTNSFEYFEYTPFFDQFSHTGMFEVNLYPFDQWRVFAQTEFWYRIINAATPRIVYSPRFGRFPGDHAEIFYRCGIDFFPWSELPYRFSAFATNKAVVAATDISTPLPDRFNHRDFFFVEGVFQL